MKKVLYTAIAMALLTVTACNGEKEHTHPEHEELKEEVKRLEKKLEATEDQLLNVRTELSKYKAKDSTEIQTGTTDE